MQGDVLKKYEVWYVRDGIARHTWMYDEDATYDRLQREFFDSREDAQKVADSMTAQCGGSGATYEVREV